MDFIKKIKPQSPLSALSIGKPAHPLIHLDREPQSQTVAGENLHWIERCDRRLLPRTIPLHIVYCKTRTLLTKRHYKDWREIQDTFDDYMTSLGPWLATEVINFFRDDFGEESRWPFSKARIKVNRQNDGSGA